MMSEMHASHKTYAESSSSQNLEEEGEMWIPSGGCGDCSTGYCDDPEKMTLDRGSGAILVRDQNNGSRALKSNSVGIILAGLVGILLGMMIQIHFGANNPLSSSPNQLAIHCADDEQAQMDPIEASGLERVKQQIQPLSGVTVPITVPSDYLLQHAKNRSMNYESFADPKYHQLVSGHPALENILPNFLPRDEWVTSHFPDINIIGLPKAGTSQLYNILVTHPRFRKFHLHPEFCFNLEDEDIQDLIVPSLGNDTSIHDQQRIQQRLHIANEEHLHSNKEEHRRWENLNLDISQGAVTVNKCLVPTKFWVQRQYLGRNHGTPLQRGKTILLLRDPADWLWASWNYWLQVPFEDALPAYKHNWAKEPFQYRSPQLFHEYMLAGDRLWPAQHLLEGFRDEKIALYNRILSDAIQSEDILVLKSEDMKPDRIETSGFLDDLASFLGVAKVNFDTSVLHSYTNCGNFKGVENHECDDDSTLSYNITGNRPMLPETRELIYLHFAEECQMWKEKFNVEYPECLAVRKKYIV